MDWRCRGGMGRKDMDRSQSVGRYSDYLLKADRMDFSAASFSLLGGGRLLGLQRCTE